MKPSYAYRGARRNAWRGTGARWTALAEDEIKVRPVQPTEHRPHQSTRERRYK